MEGTPLSSPHDTSAPILPVLEPDILLQVAFMVLVSMYDSMNIILL
jgi:hypothetical protein